MKTQNSVQLIGYLGGDPCIKTAANGSQYISFRVATDSFQKRKDEAVVKKTSWHRVLAWGRLTERIPGNFIRGSHILVRGEIRNHSYKDKEGNTQEVIIVRATQLLNLDR